MNKIREIIDNPEVANDVKRSIGRDRGRFVAVSNAVDVLESVMVMRNMFQNTKHSTGLISSYGSASDQIALMVGTVQVSLSLRFGGFVFVFFFFFFSILFGFLFHDKCVLYQTALMVFNHPLYITSVAQDMPIC